jgi:uncharacterized MAPEG superfamily protein
MDMGLHWLAASCLLTALIWLPYGLELIVHQGLMTAMGNRESLRAFAPWAGRLRRAHANAVENLVVFAAILLVAHAVGGRGEITAAAAQIYFWARLVHVLAYAAGIVVVRTFAFVAGWGVTLWLCWSVLAA